MWKRVNKKKFVEAINTISFLKVQPWSPYVYYQEASDWRNVKDVARTDLEKMFFRKYWIWEEE